MDSYDRSCWWSSCLGGAAKRLPIIREAQPAEGELPPCRPLLVVARLLRRSEALSRPLLILVRILILVLANHGAQSDPRPHPTCTTRLNEKRPERFRPGPDTQPPGVISSSGGLGRRVCEAGPPHGRRGGRDAPERVGARSRRRYGWRRRMRGAAPARRLRRRADLGVAGAQMVPPPRRRYRRSASLRGAARDPSGLVSGTAADIGAALRSHVL